MSTSSIHRSHNRRNAWLSLLGLPLALLAAFFIGNAVMSSVGVPEGELLPLQWILAMLLIVVVLLAIPVALVDASAVERLTKGTEGQCGPSGSRWHSLCWRS